MLSHRTGMTGYQLPENSERPPNLRLWRRGWRRQLLGLLLRLGRRPRRGPVLGGGVLLLRNRRGCRLRLVRGGGCADDSRLGPLTLGQPDVVDRMFDGVQARA